jgi:hypothetical protein
LKYSPWFLNSSCDFSGLRKLEKKDATYSDKQDYPIAPEKNQLLMAYIGFRRI